MRFPLGEMIDGLLVRVDALARDRKFVAGEPTNGVAAAHDPDESLRDRLQQLIAECMPELLIDEREAVDVTHDRGHAAAVALGVREPDRQAVD